MKASTKGKGSWGRREQRERLKRQDKGEFLTYKLIFIANRFNARCCTPRGKK
jgi:hypothetical protein